MVSAPPFTDRPSGSASLASGTSAGSGFASSTSAGSSFFTAAFFPPLPFFGDAVGVFPRFPAFFPATPLSPCSSSLTSLASSSLTSSPRGGDAPPAPRVVTA